MGGSEEGGRTHHTEAELCGYTGPVDHVPVLSNIRSRRDPQNLAKGEPRQLRGPSGSGTGFSVTKRKKQGTSLVV